MLVYQQSASWQFVLRRFRIAGMRFRLALLLAIGFGSHGLLLAEIGWCDEEAASEHFELHVRPLLIEKCLHCHSGASDAESDLTLNSRQALLSGGDFGPAIVPGNSAESLLIRAVKRTDKDLKMPPDEKDRLLPGEIEDLRRWIDAGAPWPRGETNLPSELNASEQPDKQPETDHWAFQPPRRIVPPTTDDPEWNENPIDRFILARLKEQGISPVLLADKRTLIRRATFDLIGLPPTPEEINAFLSDSSENAYQKLIDRLLQSPHYGERWGRHWLDVARYADTQGDVGDFPIPQAYLYRNWVIDALNADMPYDQFVQAQLAGDLLAKETSDLNEARGLIVATGFVSLSRRFGNTKYEDQPLTIEDTLDTIGRGLLGITLRCARCHDHKFDPLLQSDYYGMYGIFQSTRYPTMGASNEKSPSELSPQIPDAEQQQEIDEYFTLIARYAYQINNHFRPWLKPTLDEFKQITSRLANPNLPTAERTKIEVRREELLETHEGNFRELMLNGLEWIKREKDRLASHPPTEMVYAISDAQPTDARLHLRGNPENLGRVVARRFPLVMTADRHPALQGSGRLELARWIASPENPLTARVIVNRVWQHHLGRGLVATSSNFGKQGTLPSHPNLLDFLAKTFVEEDAWSLKSLHRRIMLSRTYRLSSETTPDNQDQDPGNLYLSHYSRRRLEAEAIRDAILSVSGQLDRSRGEGFPFPNWNQAQYSLNSPFKAEYKSNRRSVYLMTQRLFRQPFFALFDGPDRNQSTAERNASTLPTQVLYLLNSPFVNEQAIAFSELITSRTSDDTAAIQLVYERVYGRSPTEQEAAEILGRLTALRQRLSGISDVAPDQIPRLVWSSVAKAIFTSNEFLFVE